ncbi:uncharacterized protein LOC120327091 isoform X1 [Styela clava]
MNNSHQCVSMQEFLDKATELLQWMLKAENTLSIVEFGMKRGVRKQLIVEGTNLLENGESEDDVIRSVLRNISEKWDRVKQLHYRTEHQLDVQETDKQKCSESSETENRSFLCLPTLDKFGKTNSNNKSEYLCALSKNQLTCNEQNISNTERITGPRGTSLPRLIISDAEEVQSSTSNFSESPPPTSQLSLYLNEDSPSPSSTVSIDSLEWDPMSETTNVSDEDMNRIQYFEDGMTAKQLSDKIFCFHLWLKCEELRTYKEIDEKFGWDDKYLAKMLHQCVSRNEDISKKSEAFDIISLTAESFLDNSNQTSNLNWSSINEIKLRWAIVMLKQRLLNLQIFICDLQCILERRLELIDKKFQTKNVIRHPINDVWSDCGTITKIECEFSDEDYIITILEI